MKTDELLKAGYILTTVNNPGKTGLFLVGKFSHGNHESKAEMNIESVDELKAVLRYLKWREEAFTWNGDISYRQERNYSKMEDDFYAQTGEEWRDKYLWDGFDDWWPMDETSGGDMQARLSSYEVIFYDGQTEWKVTI